MEKHKPSRRDSRQTPRRQPERHPAGDKRPRAKGPRSEPGEGPFWLYGSHAVTAALANPARTCQRLLATSEAMHRDGENLGALLTKRRSQGTPGAPDSEILTRMEIAKKLPEGAVHQGLALLTDPLDQPDLTVILSGNLPIPPASEAVQGTETVKSRAVVVLLDQLSDPQNVGAVLRSAAAFGARAVITTIRHAPPESGALAKAASGALEHIPYIQVTNLGQALAALKEAGFWCLGLDGEADQPLAQADPGGPLALVLGAEGSGLRRMTRENCDFMARLPTSGPIATLNVSNAAAVALYELLGRKTGE